MICLRCLARGASRSLQPKPSQSFPIKSAELTPILTLQTQSQTNQRTFTTSPQRTSNAASHIPPSPTAARTSKPPPPSSSTSSHASTQAQTPKSSVPAGTILKGLNYFKDKEDPIALEDSEYPAWLWTVLENPKKGGVVDTKGQGDEEKDPRLYSKSAKARRAANKRLRAARAQNADSSVDRTPVYEQSFDLPVDSSVPSTAAGSGSEGVGGRDMKGGMEKESVTKGLDARAELQRAMRAKRRHDIKTKNFLKGIN